MSGAAAKADILRIAEQHLCPDRVRFLRAAGIDLVIGRREGYRLWDIEGRPLLDLHLNGGVYNLGHRNPRIRAALVAALDELDIGNHHFPSPERALLAQRLVGTIGGMQYAVFASGGGEAVDVAIKSARRATGRRRIISAAGAYHGHTGLALAAGDVAAARSFISDRPEEFIQVPFNDAGALDEALADGDAAAVVLETIPATAGFPRPDRGYLASVRDLCDAYGALYIADEVQTGLGRCGSMWAVQGFDVAPDILVTGKGLSGGLFPIAATLLSADAGTWLQEDGWSHNSTFGGAEPGCRVAGEVLDVTDELLAEGVVAALIDAWREGLAALQARHEKWLVEVRQSGLVIGLRFGHEYGGMMMTRLLFDEGVWAMFAGFDRSVLQVKPGLLLSAAETEEALAALDRACTRAEGQ